MRTLLFRIIPESVPKVWRTIKILENQTLHDLHRITQEAFGLKGNRLYAFYMSRKHWDTDNEYGGPISGSPRKAPKTMLGKLNLEKGRRFLYVYDYDREFWFEVEFIDEGEVIPKESYPKVIERIGDYPMQDVSRERIVSAELKRIVSHVNRSINDWKGVRTRARSRNVLAKEHKIARKLHDILEHSPDERWILLEEATDLKLVDWLLSLPSEMVTRGMAEEALEICEFFSEFADRDYFLSEKALVFARTGKRENALSQLHENLSSFSHTPRLFAKAAEAYWKLNEIGHAERLYRAAMDLAADDISEREFVLEGLVAMLEEHERSDEAIELLRSEQDRG